MIYHCLFEQSGTFKNVLKANGYQAFDYDILNDYGQIDRQIDIFKEIELEYDNIVNSYLYEYSMFELVHQLKTIDFEKYDIIECGW